MKTALRATAVVASLAVVAIAAFVTWFWYAAYRDRSAPSVPTEVIVPRGAAFSEVARQLGRAGVIDDVTTFRILARLRHQETEVRAGEYRFAAHQTQSDVLRALIGGGAQVAAWVTIPEGFTADQIARRLGEDGVGDAGAYARAFARDSIVVDGTRTRGLEGFLFPSTYLVSLGASPAQVEAQMTQEFFRELPAGAPALARAQHVSVVGAVTVASLVEREAKAAADRPQIAGVIYNRLRLGMPLEVDATIEYALPSHKSELSYADLRIASPYNTYLHAGLPPTPIANPGRPSLEAALRPSKNSYLYYVYCGHGRHVFASTLAQHNANVARCLQ
ncbi:MAG TPA: endolytic transglycosylase MltG [Candidatus Acidoferrales bacterium]|nr:endolytic transglycosylase MltG [Candidatus Acidoferrales bacterium]